MTTSMMKATVIPTMTTTEELEIGFSRPVSDTGSRQERRRRTTTAPATTTRKERGRKKKKKKKKKRS